MENVNGLEAILVGVTPELVGGELDSGSDLGAEKVMTIGCLERSRGSDKLVPLSDRTTLDELLTK